MMLPFSPVHAVLLFAIQSGIVASVEPTSPHYTKRKGIYGVTESAKTGLLAPEFCAIF